VTRRKVIESFGGCLPGQPLVPSGPDLLCTVIAVVPLQLLAYHVATARDLDVDKPRNLAKTVTVE
jgi:glucosamine--fructose-6-phosphate aminotransferase (isomerizing)